MITYIYTLNDPITGIPVYVGKTHQNPKRRYSQHISSELHHVNKKANWIKSLKNKGLLPILDIIDSTEDENWEWLEKYWISQFKTWGFTLKNLTDGGEGNKGQVFSEESINKRRLKLLGKPRSKETRDKISKGHIGKKLSDVTKNKLRQINLGKKYSKESCAKKYKAVLQFDTNNNLIKEYESFKEAYTVLNYKKSTFSTILKRKKFHKGYLFIYKQDIV